MPTQCVAFGQNFHNLITAHPLRSLLLLPFFPPETTAGIYGGRELGEELMWNEQA